MAITRVSVRFPTGRRILAYKSSDRTLELYDELTVSSSESVFGYLEGSVESTTSSSDGIDKVFCGEGEDENSENSLEENRSFWENQHNTLQATLYRTTSLETGIRNVTREAVRKVQSQGSYCKCSKAVACKSCRNCLMREVSIRLRNAGYNCAICLSKWRSSHEIPSGEHSYLDVLDNSNPKKEVRVIIELNFRAEFEMARSSEEYAQLVSRLPEIFVAKVERLRALIKVLSSAAKKCMKDNKMHMGPWRKQKYMLAKWSSSTCERKVEANVPINRTYSNHTIKPVRASMLTMALLDMRHNAVAAA